MAAMPAVPKRFPSPTTPRRWSPRARGATAVTGALVLSLGVLAGPSAAAPTDQDTASDAGAPAGQVVLDLEAQRGDRESTTASFYSPNGVATLRLHDAERARGYVRVNGRVDGRATAALARGSEEPIDLSAPTEPGLNTLEVTLVRGSVTVSVDYPVLVEVDAEDAGVDTAALAALDAAVESRLGLDSTDRYTGAVALVAQKGRIIHQQAFGDAQTHDGVEPLATQRPTTTDTIFDMASVTKVAATTAAVMALDSEGRIDLDGRLDTYLPQFAGDEKGAITVRQLITHRSGLWEWQPTYLHGRNKEEVLDFLVDLDLRYPIGEQRRYSDIGFMLLGAIVEEITGQTLDAYVQERVYEPLGMTSSSFTPEESLRERIAATSLGNAYEYNMIDTGRPYPIVGDLDPDDFTDWRDYTLVGEVNDGNAWYGWEGVAGHAGLFSTAEDIAIYAQTMINGGGYADAQLASAGTVATFLEPQYDDGQVLGFWSDRLSVAGATGGFGHSGFTGTEFLFDPERELVVVLLTNRLHPDRGPGSIFPVWQAVVQNAMLASGTQD